MSFAMLQKLFNAATYYALQLAMPRRSRCGGIGRRPYRADSTVGRQAGDSPCRHGEWTMRPYLTAMILAAKLMFAAAPGFAQGLPLFTPDRPLFPAATKAAPALNGQIKDLKELCGLLDQLHYSYKAEQNCIVAVFKLDDLDIPIRFMLSVDKAFLYLKCGVATEGAGDGAPLPWEKFLRQNEDIHPGSFSYVAEARQVILRYPCPNVNMTKEELDLYIGDLLNCLQKTRSSWDAALPANREKISSPNGTSAPPVSTVPYPAAPFPGSTFVAADKPQASSSNALSALNRIQELRARTKNVMVSLGQSSQAILFDKPYTLTQIYKDQRRSDVVLQEMSEELDQMPIGTDAEIRNFMAASRKAFKREVNAYLKLMEVSVTAIEEVDDTALTRQLAKTVIRNGVVDFNRELTAAGMTYEEARSRLVARFNLGPNR